MSRVFLISAKLSNEIVALWNGQFVDFGVFVLMDFDTENCLPVRNAVKSGLPAPVVINCLRHGGDSLVLSAL